MYQAAKMVTLSSCLYGEAASVATTISAFLPTEICMAGEEEWMPFETSALHDVLWLVLEETWHNLF
jgi:hypothetical protein